MSFYYKIKQDYVIFRGKDSHDLLHRLSTNDVKSAEKFIGKKTILTTDKGRIVDVLTLYNFEDFIFSSCSINNSGNVLKHLEKYTITEDFNAHNMPGSHESILVSGENADKFSSDVLDFDRTAASNNDFSIYKFKGKDIIVARNDDAFKGCLIIYLAEDKTLIEQELIRSSFDSYHIEEIDESKYEIFRIERGVPRFGKEITENVNPLECNLSQYISFTKGCYIGQEVIARLDTYDKVSKHLIGVKADGNFSVEDRLVFEGKECGYITSAGESKKFGHIGLGFVKTAFLDFSKDYRIRNKNINCKIIQLPF